MWLSQFMADIFFCHCEARQIIGKTKNHLYLFTFCQCSTRQEHINLPNYIISWTLCVSMPPTAAEHAFKNEVTTTNGTFSPSWVILIHSIMPQWGTHVNMVVLFCCCCWHFCFKSWCNAVTGVISCLVLFNFCAMEF